MIENANINDGGCAFPTLETSDPRVSTAPGMTLRDYFAAKALPVALTTPWRELGYVPKDGLSEIENDARLAYQIADAMLAARTQEPKP